MLFLNANTKPVHDSTLIDKPTAAYSWSRCTDLVPPPLLFESNTYISVYKRNAPLVHP